MRVIAGTARGHRLRVPDKGTRPTSERVREAMFSRLDHFGVLNGARVLDLYAGSGSLGIEALSRGALSAVFVDSARSATRVCQENLKTTGFLAVSRVHTTTVASFLRPAKKPRTFDLVFVDPPYDFDKTTEVPELLGAGWLAEGAVVMWENPADHPPLAWAKGFSDLGVRVYGDTRLNFGEFQGV
ncbi:MAG TPA: 16S rRNA (guanine(966)-N(2))-methyltransferase RsmD [Beutenbergiaceae bacterium]|nr:16S rRNA (guanine(966)-N(2))-methyltransferase RsmD [Beutenbergiaceae bacterium]